MSKLICRSAGRAVSVALGLWVIALTGQLVLAQAPPSADTFVSSATPRINYGPSITLVVAPGTTSYLQFNLSTLPHGATISKATLRLYVDAVARSGSFDVYQLNSPWTENALTYNSPPPVLGTSATGNHPIIVGSTSLNQFLLIDVTALAQGWADGSIANDGVALALVSAAGTFSFDSKESLLTSNGPELEIALSGTGPQGPPGPAGPPGATGLQGPIGPNGAQGTQGLSGPQGIQGPIGPTGPIGPPGIEGPQGAKGDVGAQGPAGLTWRGEWDCAGNYAVGDVASYQGSSWVVANFPIGGCVQPPFEPWQLVVKQGADGSQGPPGPSGPAGLQGAIGPQGLQGLPGPQGPIGPMGPVGPTGPQGPGAFNGMQEFASATLVDPYIWVAPPNVTRVLVEMWGGGGGGGSPVVSGPGSGGAYNRTVLAVTPGSAYAIRVGGGGAAVQPGQIYGQNGQPSSISLVGGAELLHAVGGENSNGVFSGGAPDSRAAIARGGHVGNGATGAGGSAFGAQFCPGPYGETTGHGGDWFQGGIPGYVLLTW